MSVFRSHRRIPLAWRNLTENRWRLLASVGGTAFAVVLMLVQDGFRNALLNNMVEVITHVEGDLFVTLRTRYMFAVPMPLPRRRLERVKGIEGVASVQPFYLDPGQAPWRNPVTRLARPIRVIGYPPEADLLDITAVRAQRAAWDQPDVALADDRSKRDFYGPLTPGTVSELKGRRLTIAGVFRLGTDFRSNGTLVMSERNFLRYFPERNGPGWGDTAVDLGVVRLAAGVDPAAVKARVADRLTRDVMVLTKGELIGKERRFWETATPVGIVFDIGVLMGFIVGMAICYQVLFSEVSDRLPEFATLKAMGYSNGALLGVIVREGVYLALLGYAVGVAVAFGLFRWLQAETGLNMRLDPPSLAAILGLTVLMCVLSGRLAARRLGRLDPAELYG